MASLGSLMSCAGGCAQRTFPPSVSTPASTPQLWPVRRHSATMTNCQTSSAGRGEWIRKWIIKLKEIGEEILTRKKKSPNYKKLGAKVSWRCSANSRCVARGAGSGVGVPSPSEPPVLPLPHTNPPERRTLQPGPTGKSPELNCRGNTEMSETEETCQPGPSSAAAAPRSPPQQRFPWAQRHESGLQMRTASAVSTVLLPHLPSAANRWRRFQPVVGNTSISSGVATQHPGAGGFYSPLLLSTTNSLNHQHLIKTKFENADSYHSQYL